MERAKTGYRHYRQARNLSWGSVGNGNYAINTKVTDMQNLRQEADQHRWSEDGNRRKMGRRWYSWQVCCKFRWLRSPKSHHSKKYSTGLSKIQHNWKLDKGENEKLNVLCQVDGRYQKMLDYFTYLLLDKSPICNEQMAKSVLKCVSGLKLQMSSQQFGFAL